MTDQQLYGRRQHDMVPRWDYWAAGAVAAVIYGSVVMLMIVAWTAPEFLKHLTP